MVPYHLFVNELHEYMDQRRRACASNVLDIIFMQKILLSHECAIYRSSHPRNIAFCGKENLYFFKEIENNPPHVMI
jgi:hypothetical protein